MIGVLCVPRFWHIDLEWCWLHTEYLDIFDSVCCHFKFFNPFQRSNLKLKSPFATTSVSCMSSGYPWCLWSSWSCWPPSWPSRPPWSPFVSSEVGQSVYLAGSRRWDDCVFEGLVQHWKRTTGVEDSRVERVCSGGWGEAKRLGRLCKARPRCLETGRFPDVVLVEEATWGM